MTYPSAGASKLLNLSLDKVSRKVYEHVLENGFLDPGAIRESLDLNREQLDENIWMLVELKLLRSVPHTGQIVACRPDLAAAETISPFENEIRCLEKLVEQTRRAFDDLMHTYLAAENRRRSAEDIIDTLPNEHSVNVLLDKAASSCTTEVLTMQSGRGRQEKDVEASLARDKAMLERGVLVLTLYQHSARFTRQPART